MPHITYVLPAMGCIIVSQGGAGTNVVPSLLLSSPVYNGLAQVTHEGRLGGLYVPQYRQRIVSYTTNII